MTGIWSCDSPRRWTVSVTSFLSSPRPMENSLTSPVFFKVKKTQEASTPSHNGELVHQRGERRQHSHTQPSLQLHLPPSEQSRSQSTSSDAGGSESEGGSLPPSYPDEDPERMKHSKITAFVRGAAGAACSRRVCFTLLCALCFSLEPGRKQKTPKKFTGEQPSISGTFGLKGRGQERHEHTSYLLQDPEMHPDFISSSSGPACSFVLQPSLSVGGVLTITGSVCVAGMSKVEEKLKAGRAKRSEGSGFNEEPQRRPTPNQSSKKDAAASSSGEHQTFINNVPGSRGPFRCSCQV